MAVMMMRIKSDNASIYTSEPNVVTDPSANTRLVRKVSATANASMVVKLTACSSRARWITRAQKPGQDRPANNTITGHMGHLFASSPSSDHHSFKTVNLPFGIAIERILQPMV